MSGYYGIPRGFDKLLTLEYLRKDQQMKRIFLAVFLCTSSFASASNLQARYPDDIVRAADGSAIAIYGLS
ncbi:hypothetical protein E3A20_20640, partial [Planctomyces bekefii]